MLCKNRDTPVCSVETLVAVIRVTGVCCGGKVELGTGW